MPITKSALKAVRKTKRKTKINKPIRETYKNAVKRLRKESTPANLAKAYAALDLAAKNKVIHKNKASRLKSRLAKILKPTSQKSVPIKPKQKKH